MSIIGVCFFNGFSSSYWHLLVCLSQVSLSIPYDGLGMDLPSLHMIQIILQLQLFAKHWRLSLPTGQLLCCSFEEWAVVLGTTSPTKLSTHRRQLLAARCWWQGLVEQIEIYELDFDLTTGLERNSLELMLVVDPWLTNNKILNFNWCRLFFGVTLVNELFAEDTTIHSHLLRRPNRNSPWQEGNWPVTKPPSQPAFNVWSITIQRIAKERTEGLHTTLLPTSLWQHPAIFRTDRAAIISDGGAKDGAGGFGTILVTNSAYCEVVSRVPPGTGTISAYCSELSGITAGLGRLATEGYTQVTLCCDNNSTLDKAGKLPHPNAKDHDLCTILSYFAKHMTIQHIQVLGHADMKVKDRPLSNWELANVRADELATLALSDTPEATLLKIPWVPGQIRFFGQAWPTFRRKQLYYLMGKPFKKEFLCKFHNWTHRQYDSIQWNWLRCTQAKNPPVLRRWLFKIANKVALVHHRRKKWQQIPDGGCLFCDALDKEFHCLVCPAHRRAWDQIWHQLKIDLDELDEYQQLVSRLKSIYCQSPAWEDLAQYQLGVPATMLGLWSTSFNLVPSDRGFFKTITQAIWLVQFAFCSIYIYHVTQTHHAEHKDAKDAKDALESEIKSAWDTCAIPPELSRFHPTKTEITKLLVHLFNVKKLWLTLHHAHQALSS